MFAVTQSHAACLYELHKNQDIWDFTIPIDLELFLADRALIHFLSTPSARPARNQSWLHFYFYLVQKLFFWCVQKKDAVSDEHTEAQNLCLHCRASIKFEL